MTNTAAVIGGGIVGLHVAHVLRDKGFEVFVLERESYLAEHTSGRNSGVIHAGIFYKTGSVKERLCVEGNAATYEWLKRLDVAHIACGKWVVPDDGREESLEDFFARIRALPIPEPRLLSAGEVAQAEPLLRRTPAVLIPSTGVLDAAGYVNAMAAFVENRGVTLIKPCRVMGLNGNVLQTTRGEMPFDLAVNCAGLFADEIAALAGETGYEIRPCRGDYYTIAAAPLKRPVYHLPVPGAHGLGVHLTPTFDGRTLLGPNAFFIEKKTDYAHRSAPEEFAAALKHYLPDFPAPQVAAAYSGNRPKLYRDGNPVTEFTFFKRDNWIHLLGIESPGLTAAPALAKAVADLIYQPGRMAGPT